MTLNYERAYEIGQENGVSSAVVTRIAEALHAQDDARPFSDDEHTLMCAVEHLRDVDRNADATFRIASKLDAMRKRLFTRPAPEAARAGLSELQDEIARAMQPWVGPQGGIYAVHSCALDVAKFILAHAATVAELPEDYREGWDKLSNKQLAIRMGQMNYRLTALKKENEGLRNKQSAKQRAEPVGDERVAFEAQASEWGWDLRREANDPNEYLLASTAAAWGGWQARAAQSGQRAGVEEDARIKKGTGALRYLLNIGSEDPDELVGAVMDRTRTSDGVTTRQALESLWEALAASPTPAAQGGV